ncbi:MAG: tripartite tricarboxylate transporter permease [Candidatus Micrarchaeota archaeon]
MGDIESFIIGLVFGFVTGFFPGLHPNMLISAMSNFGLDGRTLALIIISLYPANLISAFIPSIFFGIPDSRTIVAILPGQRMVVEGKGLTALKIVLFSSIVTAFLSISFLYLSMDFFVFTYGIIKQHMRWILLGISILLLLKTKKPHFSLFVFLLSGLLGRLSFESDMIDPFLPLFSGMFAMAAIVNYRKSKIPEQKEEEIKFDFLLFVFIGSLLGMLADLIPGVGSPAQVAVFATIFIPMNTLGYLATISSISVSQAIFALATSISIGKSRIGAVVWLAEAINIKENLVFLTCLFIISLSIAVFGIYLLRKYIAKLSSLDFSKVNIFLAAYLILITVAIDGTTGIMILILSTTLGWLTVKIGVERTNLMGSIILPTLFLLFRI